jgi:hypothetical protein
MGLHDAIAYGIYKLISASVKAVWRTFTPKPCSHGVTGYCQVCTDEAISRSPEGIALARQQRLAAIYAEYSAIDEDLRESLKSNVEDRVRRYDLRCGPGDLEAAVVRMYRADSSRRTSK